MSSLFWGCVLCLLSFLCSLRPRRLLPVRCFLLAFVPVRLRLLPFWLVFLRGGVLPFRWAFLLARRWRRFFGVFVVPGVPSRVHPVLVLGLASRGVPCVGLRPFRCVCCGLLLLPFPVVEDRVVFPSLPRLSCRVTGL